MISAILLVCICYYCKVPPLITLFAWVGICWQILKIYLNFISAVDYNNYEEAQ